MSRKAKQILWLLIIVVSPRVALSQHHYLTTLDGTADIQFVIEGQLHSAKTKAIEIIYNQKKEIVWLRFPVKSFQMENKKLRKRLFKKNPTHFVVKGDLSSDNIIRAGNNFFQFSFIGKIFNDDNNGPVSASGRFAFVLSKQKNECGFTLIMGVEKKWFGEKFASRSSYPVVNIQVSAILLNPITTISNAEDMNVNGPQFRSIEP
ncbi:MAG: hypothetical protein RID25_15475 [Cyclobacteriaceae bacterium]